jgi:copper(I)-binding protein
MTHSGCIEIQTTLLQRDIQRQTKRSISVSLTALRQNDQVNVLAASPAVDLGDAVMQATAPMSKRTAILRNCENKDSKTRRFVEVSEKRTNI